MASTNRLIVRGLSRQGRHATVMCGPLRAACALGRSGRMVRKREGDGATPVGRFRLLAVLYRPDRRRRPCTHLPVRPIRSTDGWCDTPSDRNYNRAVRLPYPAGAERLWREDHIYDVIVVLAHNTRPRVRGGGSAIFMHVARPGLLPTEGCVALAARDLDRLLAYARRNPVIVVT